MIHFGAMINIIFILHDPNLLTHVHNRIGHRFKFVPHPCDHPLTLLSLQTPPLLHISIMHCVHFFLFVHQPSTGCVWPFREAAFVELLWWFGDLLAVNRSQLAAKSPPAQLRVEHTSIQLHF